ncbi:MAG: helix-turn-helix domain-containing protein [Pseudobdellovibrionaceae bacterium]
MQSSIQAKQISLLIKNLLKKHDATYADLAKVLGVTEASVKRIMAKSDFTLARLELIADWFGFDFFEFVEKAKLSNQEPFYFNKEQELALAQTPAALYTLILLSVGFSLEKIRKKLTLDPREFQRLLFVLDKNNLIELKHEGKIKIRARAPFQMLEAGPLRSKFSSVFLNHALELIKNANKDNSQLIVSEFYMSEELLNKMRNEISGVHKKYMHLAKMEQEIVSIDQFQAVTEVIFNTVHNSWERILLSST